MRNIKIATCVQSPHVITRLEICLRLQTVEEASHTSYMLQSKIAPGYITIRRNWDGWICRQWSGALGIILYPGARTNSCLLIQYKVVNSKTLAVWPPYWFPRLKNCLCSTTQKLTHVHNVQVNKLLAFSILPAWRYLMQSPGASFFIVICWWVLTQKHITCEKTGMPWWLWKYCKTSSQFAWVTSKCKFLIFLTGSEN